MSNEQTTVIRAKALLDGTDAPPVPNAVVVIQGDRIVAAGPEEAVEVPRGPDVRELDHRDGYLLPGLIDAHTHLMFGAGERSYEQVATIAIVGGVTLDQLWHAVPAFPTISEFWLRFLEAYGL